MRRGGRRLALIIAVLFVVPLVLVSSVGLVVWKRYFASELDSWEPVPAPAIAAAPTAPAGEVIFDLVGDSETMSVGPGAYFVELAGGGLHALDGTGAGRKPPGLVVVSRARALLPRRRSERPLGASSLQGGPRWRCHARAVLVRAALCPG